MYLLNKAVNFLRLWQEMGSNSKKMKNKVYDVRKKDSTLKSSKICS